MQKVGEKFFLQGEAMAPAKSSSHGGANNDFPVRKGENISGGGILEVALVEAATGGGGNKNKVELGGKSPRAGGGKASEGEGGSTTEEGQIEAMAALAIGPMEENGSWSHDDLEDNKFWAGGYSAKRWQGSGGRMTIRFGLTVIFPNALPTGGQQKVFRLTWRRHPGRVFRGSGRRTRPYRRGRGGRFRGIGEWGRSSGRRIRKRGEYLRPVSGGFFPQRGRLFRVARHAGRKTRRERSRGARGWHPEFFEGGGEGGRGKAHPSHEQG